MQRFCIRKGLSYKNNNFKMKSIKTLFLLLLLLYSSTSCKKETSNTGNCNCDTGNYIIFGRFCGECITNCATMYKLNDSCLWVDNTQNYVLSTGINFNGVLVSKAKFQLVKDLKSKLPTQLLNSNSATIGQPDSHDQCGYYVESNTNGVKKIWLIDTDTTMQPTYLRPFILEIQQVLNLLN